jgi:hypothetical protein
MIAWTLASVQCQQVVPRQSWDLEWGHMVPHKTFPADCSICHLPERWDVIRDDFQFDHEKETGYALEGAHAEATCLRCHNDRGPVKTYLARGCGGCHTDFHQGTLGMECTRCHDQDTWAPTGLIAEHARTRFPLAASHAVAPCESCHLRATTGEFRGAPVECALCHQRDAAGAVPNHVINNWVRGCENCHDITTFSSAPGFNHDGFPLTNSHSGLSCLQCHPGGRFVPISTDCFPCHQQDYIAAPNHVANNLSTRCTDCHNTAAWK